MKETVKRERQKESKRKRQEVMEIEREYRNGEKHQFKRLQGEKWFLLIIVIEIES